MGIFSFNAWKNSINESLATARARFLKPGFVDQATFDQLKALDPTPTFKYLEKIIGFYLNDKVHIKELGQVVSRFHTLLNRNQVKTRDINAFKSFNDLRSETQSSETQYALKKEIKSRSKDYDRVYEDRDWIVIIPRTHEASCKYGAGTKWCTSAEDAGHYKSYTEIGITLYYIISKKFTKENRFYKMAVAVNYFDDGMKCFDSLDDSISFEKVLEISGLNRSIFIPVRDNLTPYEVLGLDESNVIENLDGSIDYDGTVSILGMDLIKIPINFGIVTGDFICSKNKLKYLDGAPKEVGGSFICSNNMLESLNGGPKKVGGSFDCSKNKLTTLDGAPKEVGGSFTCNNNMLTSLLGMPIVINHDFNCSDNKLQSLDYAPKEVGRNYYCDGNQLTSLRGAPKQINGYFDCSRNKLKSLKDSPSVIKRSFDCSNNRLTSLNGGPVFIKDEFNCFENPSLSELDKQWAMKNIKAKSFEF